MSADFMDMSMMARYLFAPSTLPLPHLLMKSNIQVLESFFSFHSLQVEADSNQFRLVGGGGEFEGIPIQQLLIDSISITLSVVGERSEIERVYEALRQFLIQIDSKRRMEQPALYTMTYQTQSTVRLAIPYKQLLSKTLVDFLDSKKEALRPIGSTSVELNLASLSFQVKFTSSSEAYFYLPKVLTIEPRAGSDPKENVYYIVTPTDSDTHKELVAEFEKAMNQRS